jgi:hypothetical protein
MPPMSADFQSLDNLNAAWPALFAASFQFGAELVLRLKNSGELHVLPDGRCCDHRGALYLADLAAAIILETWETQGFRGHIEAGLPTADEARQVVARNCAENCHPEIAGRPAQTIDNMRRLSVDNSRPDSVLIPKVDMDRLAMRVLVFWLKRFGWTSFEYFDADIAISGELDDAFVDRIAEFLWRHRHTLPPDRGTIVEQSE